MHTKPKAQAALQTPGPCSHCKAQTIPDAETQEPECAPVSDPPDAEGTLPPPHPALVELVRILARADARQVQENERRPQ